MLVVFGWVVMVVGIECGDVFVVFFFGGVVWIFMYMEIV